MFVESRCGAVVEVAKNKIRLTRFRVELLVANEALPR